MPGPVAEVDITTELVTELLRAQHPDLAEHRLHDPVAGWDNVTFRLGEDLAMRLPRRAAAAALILHEQRWLPDLAPRLPLPTPVPVRFGMPTAGYPWAWSVCPWLPGVEIERAPPDDWEAAAEQLGAFLRAMHQPAPADAPRNPYRGVPLADRVPALVDGLDRLDSAGLDFVALSDRWSTALAADLWAGPPLWLHGDVHPLNLLVDKGRLSAVIDFGDLTAGDPASDLAVVWMLLPPDVWSSFRAAHGGIDDALWARARGWAIALGVALANGDDRIAAIGRRTLAAVLADDA